MPTPSLEFPAINTGVVSMNAPFLTSNFSLLEEQPFCVALSPPSDGQAVTPFQKQNRYAGLPVPEEPLCFSAGEVA